VTSAPCHLVQLSERTRHLVESQRALWESEDARLEAAILQAAREARIAERVPPLCDALCASGLSKRMAFQIAGLVLGRDPNHVLRLYYARRHA